MGVLQPGTMKGSNKMRWIGMGGVVLLVWLFLASGCIVSEVPANVRRYQATRAARYPWTAEAIDEESKARLCAALELDPNNPFCQPGVQVATEDLMAVLRKRLPENKTSHEEVAKVLQGFPVVVEESITLEGEVTSRGYAYLLTQFEGFCVYFFVNLVTNTITRIDNTKAPGVFDGPIPTRCGPTMR